MHLQVMQNIHTNETSQRWDLGLRQTVVEFSNVGRATWLAIPCTTFRALHEVQIRFSIKFLRTDATWCVVTFNVSFTQFGIGDNDSTTEIAEGVAVGSANSCI